MGFETSWRLYIQSTDAEELWDDFKKQIMFCQNTYIPPHTKSAPTNNKPKWFIHDIARAIKKERLKKKKLIKLAKREYEMNIAKESKTNPIRFYRYIEKCKI